MQCSVSIEVERLKLIVVYVQCHESMLLMSLQISLNLQPANLSVDVAEWSAKGVASILDGNNGYTDVAQVERVTQQSVATRRLVVDGDWKTVST
jgi:hypothetical protein